MKKAIILVSCFLSAFAAHGQEPAPPTQEWCKWAFQQIPDHRDIAEVDAEAFSVDFYTLLKIALSAINLRITTSLSTRGCSRYDSLSTI